MRHARPVDLGVDVADEVGFKVEILDERQRVVGIGAAGVLFKKRLRAVAAKLALELIAEKLRPHRIAQDRNRVEIGFDRAARHAFEGGLGAEHARRPVGLRIDFAEHAKERLTDRLRQRRAHALLHQMQAIAAITAEGFVATVTGERDRHVLARQFADTVSRDRRAVGVGLVVKSGERVDKVEIVAGDGLDAVIGLVAVGDRLRECGFVERGVVEAHRAGIDRRVRLFGHQRDDGT